MITDDLLAAAQGVLPDVVELRRDLHVHPELGNHLPRTQGRVLEALDGLGLEISTGTARRISTIQPTGTRIHAWSERRPMASTKPSPSEPSSRAEPLGLGGEISVTSRACCSAMGGRVTADARVARACSYTDHTTAAPRA